MGLLDNVFGSDSNPALPGGNVTKPLMIALLALLASRYMSSGSKGSGTDASSSTSPDVSTPAGSDPGTISGGLGGLLKQFQQAGLGDAINSWINTGPNKTVAPAQVSDALGPDIINTLSEQTGLPRDEVAAILSQVLPQVVDQLTPDGRVPTKRDMARLMG